MHKFSIPSVMILYSPLVSVVHNWQKPDPGLGSCADFISWVASWLWEGIPSAMCRLPRRGQRWGDTWHLLAGLGLPHVGSVPGSLLRVQLAKPHCVGHPRSMERSKPEMSLEARGSQVFLLMGSPASASAQREVRGPYPLGTCYLDRRRIQQPCKPSLFLSLYLLSSISVSKEEKEMVYQA